MDNSKIGILTNAILEAQTWKPGRSALALENDFYQLMFSGPSLEERPDLWNDLREALAGNEYLQTKEMRDFLAREDFAREGYWWFDPSLWNRSVNEF